MEILCSPDSLLAFMDSIINFMFMKPKRTKNNQRGWNQTKPGPASLHTCVQVNRTARFCFANDPRQGGRQGSITPPSLTGLFHEARWKTGVPRLQPTAGPSWLHPRNIGSERNKMCSECMKMQIKIQQTRQPAGLKAETMSAHKHTQTQQALLSSYYSFFAAVKTRRTVDPMSKSLPLKHLPAPAAFKQVHLKQQRRVLLRFRSATTQPQLSEVVNLNWRHPTVDTVFQHFKWTSSWMFVKLWINIWWSKTSSALRELEQELFKVKQLMDKFVHWLRPNS